jgi:DNA gyrase subunit A
MSHDLLLLFTNKGRVYAMKGYKIPEGSRTSKGIPLVNTLDFQEGERVVALSAIDSLEHDDKYLFFVTKNGTVKRTLVSQYKNIRTTGIIAIELKEDDELLQVEVTDGNREIVLGASTGKAIHFHENDVRPIGRTAAGVRGMEIPEGAKIVGMAVITEEKNQVLVVTEKGYGKRSDVTDYRLQGRGGLGVKALNVTEKNGMMVAIKCLHPDSSEDLMIITNSGIIIKLPLDQVSTLKRATQGVRLINLKDDQKVSTVALIKHENEEEISAENENLSEQNVETVQENSDSE